MRLAAAGMPVALLARRADRLDALRARITEAGGRAVTVSGDVAREEDAQALVDAAMRAFGRLDVMIANAGAGYHATVENTPPDVARRLMDVNYLGTFLAARAALPIFRRADRGHLVIVSSIVGRRGIGGTGAYGATKAAQLGLAESLRSELAGTNIHVTTVFPVSTRTGFHEAIRRDYGQHFSALGPQQSADAVAAAIEKVLAHPRPEVYPHAASRALAIAAVVAPGLTDRFLRKYARRRTTAEEHA